MKRKIFVVILSFTLFSCNSEQSEFNKTQVFNPVVASSLNNLSKELKNRRTVLEFMSGAKANDCNTYLAEAKSSEIKEDINNQMVKSEYLICDALNLLGGKPYSVVNADQSMSNTIASRLDLRSFPSTYRPRLDDKNYTLKSIAGNKLKITGNNIIDESKDWYFKLELIAITDINEDKKPDGILWVTDESKSGNYRGYQTIVVYDINASKNKLKAQVYPKF